LAGSSLLSRSPNGSLRTLARSGSLKYGMVPLVLPTRTSARLPSGADNRALAGVSWVIAGAEPMSLQWRSGFSKISTTLSGWERATSR